METPFNLSLPAETIDSLLLWLDEKQDVIIKQTDLLSGTGQSTTATMTQKAITDALGTKADKSTTYTKTETNNLLDGKQDKDTAAAPGDVAFFDSIGNTVSSGTSISDLATKSEVNQLGQEVEKLPMVKESPIFTIEDDENMAILSIGNDFFKVSNKLIISLQSASNGQILKNINGIWTPSDNISSINELVDMTDIDTNDVLQWNGSKWGGIATPIIQSSDDFSIEDETGVPIMKIRPNEVSFGKNKLNFGYLLENHILVYNGYSFVAGQPDWVGKVIATYGDSVTASNNGNYERPYDLGQDAVWGNILASYFGFSKHYGRGIGSQTFTWAFKDGGAVSWVRPDGTYINRLNEYNYDEWEALSTKVYPSGVTAEMVAQGTAITIRSAGCSWLRITKMFPEDIKDTINVITIMYHNDSAESESVLDGDLQWVANDTTDEEWALSDEYANYGGDYNIMTTRGGIASTIMKMQAWMPNCVIVLATPISGRGTTGELNPNLTDTTMQKLASIVREMAQLMSIPCIDTYATCGINGLNRTRFISDSIHPYTLAGQKMVARAFIGGLKSIINLF